MFHAARNIQGEGVDDVAVVRIELEKYEAGGGGGLMAVRQYHNIYKIYLLLSVCIYSLSFYLLIALSVFVSFYQQSWVH